MNTDQKINYSYIILALILLYSSISLFTLIENEFNLQQTYKDFYYTDQSTTTEIEIPDLYISDLYRSGWWTNHFQENQTYYYFINSLISSDTFLQILKIKINNDYSNIDDISIHSTVLDSNNSYFSGLVHYDNFFLTFQRISNYNFFDGYNHSIYHDYAIKFNSTSVISNTSLPIHPNYEIDKFNNGGYDLYFPFQIVKNNLVTLRLLQNNTGLGASTTQIQNYYLTEYDINSLKIIKQRLVSSYNNDYWNDIEYDKNPAHFIIEGFSIDESDILWFFLDHDQLGNSRNSILAGVTYSDLKFTKSLNRDLFLQNSIYNNKTYIQIPEILGHQRTQPGWISQSYSEITQNKFVEEIHDYYGWNLHLLIGIRITDIKKHEVPLFDLSSFIFLAGGSSVTIIAINIIQKRKNEIK